MLPCFGTIESLYKAIFILTTCQMGSLAGKTCSPRLLPSRSQRILCVGLAVSSLLRGRSIARLAVCSLFDSHLVVQIARVLGRGRCIFDVWGGHNIPSTQRRHSATHGRLLWTTRALRPARLVLRAAVSSVLGVFPAKRSSQCGEGARLEAFQLRVLECNHACAGCLNGRCRGTLTAPMTSYAGDPESGGHSIRRAGMGQCCCDTEQGSMQSREHSRSTQNHG